MVVYAVAANVSIIQVFLAGFLPGLLVMALYSGYIAVWALAQPATRCRRPSRRMTLRREAARIGATSSRCLLLIAARLRVAAARLGDGDRMRGLGRARLARDRLVVGRADLGSFWTSVMGATRLTCMIMLILAGASFMSTVDGLHRHPGGAGRLGRRPATLSPYALIAALTVMYIVLGTALDGISMIVLTTVVVLPMVKKAGFDLVWFGIFLVLMVEMAEVSPPVGFNLFVLQTMSGKDSNTVALRGAAVLLPAGRRGGASSRYFPQIVMVAAATGSFPS